MNTVENVIYLILLGIAFLILFVVGYAIGRAGEIKGPCKGEHTFPDDF